ncbi:hypothetical protein JYB62_08290 [Algoriphagus lutimaris]|uniref:DUF6090 family protein n=1 Tax=Algoriphagus lutimaris TaxID=613197 RepID=UPI00196B5ED3|nr:DUF6090 family protein [Algoriphagus lutimaris]MBN3520001.1 hypothetical protein [Algoriphagus lutimaris]
MIKFFRKIRQRLLAKNKFSSYLVYAIGEIILVVIGILIALSINNWNQNRLDRNLEFQYYKRVLEDVKEEKLILEATINYSNQVIGHAKEAIAVFENSPNAHPDPVQNLIDMYQASQLQDSYSASSTYKELIASGQINLIQNEVLKTALIRFYEIEWTETGVFKLENTYRVNLRGKMPNEIQTEIRSNCNDIYVKSRGNYLTALPDACEITLAPHYARSVVEELRQDESLKKDLRYLIGNETGKQNDLKPIIIQLDDLKLLLENINND